MTTACSVARRPFHLMAKPTSYQCNLACDYCFYVEKGEGTLKTANPQRHMDDETLAAYVKSYIEANPVREIEFAWQGGEPTMAGIAFFERALALQARYAKGKVIRNTLQTNGLLIDEDWARFLAANNFLIGLSIDGPPEMHDHHRKARNGKGVAAQVLKALELFRKHKVEYNILAVVNSTTARHPAEVYRYLTRDLGATFLQFIAILEQRPKGETSGEVLYPQTRDTTAEVTDWSVSGEAYGEFIIGVFDEWVRNDVGRVFVQLFENILAAWLGQTPSLCTMQSSCGSSLIIEQNGDIYSCDHYVFPEHKLGNVKKDDLGAMVSSKKQRAFGMMKTDLPRACAQCEWKFTCHGGCPKHRIHRVDNHWHNHLCPGFKAMYAHMDPYLRFMADRLRQNQPVADVMKVADRIARGEIA